MQKDELIATHMLLVQIKNRLEQQGLLAEETFVEYTTFGVWPTHVHRSKQEHRHAILLLGKALGSFASEGERIGKRFATMAGLQKPVVRL